MNKVRLVLLVFFAVSAYLVISPDRAFAYLDMGTTSYLLNLLVMVLVGAGAFIIATWSRIKSFFGGKKSDDDNKS